MINRPDSFNRRDPYPPHIALEIAQGLSRAGDTVARVAADYPEIFDKVPAIPEGRAQILRALATELHLAGITKRLGLRVTSVVETAHGLRVEPRFDDVLLGRVVEGFEALSRLMPGVSSDA